MDELLESSEFQKRKADIDVFNKNNRWKKRGISAIPTKFGIAFTATFMNLGQKNNCYMRSRSWADVIVSTCIGLLVMFHHGFVLLPYYAMVMHLR